MSIGQHAQQCWWEEFAEALGRWWVAHDSSSAWQEGVFYALSAAYCVLGLAALAQLIRLHLRNDGGSSEIRSKIWLCFMHMLLSVTRASTFGFYLLSSPIPVLTSILLDLPVLLFFSTSTLLILCVWADLCHRPSLAVPSRLPKPTFIAINLLIYIIQAAIWICEWRYGTHELQNAARLFCASISLLAALGFAVYGTSLCIRLRESSSWGKVRRKMLREVRVLTSICLASSVARIAIATDSVFNQELHSDMLNHPLLNLIYYLVAELLPCGLLLYMKRELPPRRLQDDYHPIPQVP